MAFLRMIAAKVAHDILQAIHAVVSRFKVRFAFVCVSHVPETGDDIVLMIRHRHLRQLHLTGSHRARAARGRGRCTTRSPSQVVYSFV